jgi:hypothetical protein
MSSFLPHYQSLPKVNREYIIFQILLYFDQTSISPSHLCLEHQLLIQERDPVRDPHKGNKTPIINQIFDLNRSLSIASDEQNAWTENSNLNIAQIKKFLENKFGKIEFISVKKFIYNSLKKKFLDNFNFSDKISFKFACPTNVSFQKYKDDIIGLPDSKEAKSINLKSIKDSTRFLKEIDEIDPMEFFCNQENKYFIFIYLVFEDLMEILDLAFFPIYLVSFNLVS